MVHRLGDAACVVHLDVADALGHFADIQKHQRHVSPGELVGKSPVDLRRHDGNAVNLTVDHPPN